MLKVVVCLLAIFALAPTDAKRDIPEFNPGRIIGFDGYDNWTQCDTDEIIQCVSCIFQCGAEVVADVIELVAGAVAEQPEVEVADLDDWSQTAADCANCASVCQSPTALFNSECPAALHCATDFCYTCCNNGADICVGNDWTQICTTSNRVCICSSQSGDPDSCCSNGGPGTGENTGNYCGNDFNAGACGVDAPYCCTNDFGTPACCTTDQACVSPDTGNPYCSS